MGLNVAITSNLASANRRGGYNCSLSCKPFRCSVIEAAQHLFHGGNLTSYISIFPMELALMPQLLYGKRLLMTGHNHGCDKTFRRTLLLYSYHDRTVLPISTKPSSMLFVLHSSLTVYRKHLQYWTRRRHAVSRPTTIVAKCLLRLNSYMRDTCLTSDLSHRSYGHYSLLKYDNLTSLQCNWTESIHPFKCTDGNHLWNRTLVVSSKWALATPSC